ncbi:NADPH:quinone oxidoreductase family protein [Sphingobium sp. WCS2017Hpa-17]|uniref:NADPH:quinone oxidoreductase family protein n=1 Tax=Sphingobium sp. WCS2017Hpa-17 TaxID=3073638 RepID=UPI00288ACE88|nr:NADPH:quinone oxidoreductase family protein [Sphingobium sp. WCS2017Hpa-17]
MRALLSERPGGPDQLIIGELVDPIARPGEIIVAVQACALNYPDLLIIEDRYQIKPQRPFAPGGEVAGIVDSVGFGVSHIKAGQRVVAFAGHGGLAEKVAIDARCVYPLSDRQSFEDGAALLFAYGTAYYGLHDRGGIQPGEKLLILGAAGGVGLAAIEIGKAAGAIVIAAVSTPQKAAVASSAGADDVIVYGDEISDAEMGRTLSSLFKDGSRGTGYDLIFDPVGGRYAEPALRAISWGGRYLIIGFPAGIANLPMNLPLLKGCDVKGVFWGAFAQREPENCARGVSHLMALWDEGLIHPRAQFVYPLEQGALAVARLSDRANVGKIVVSMSPDRETSTGSGGQHAD